MNPSRRKAMIDNYATLKLKAQAAVLRDLMTDYSGRTIDNILANIETRIKYYEDHETAQR